MLLIYHVFRILCFLCNMFFKSYVDLCVMFFKSYVVHNLCCYFFMWRKRTGNLLFFTLQRAEAFTEWLINLLIDWLIEVYLQLVKNWVRRHVWQPALYHKLSSISRHYTSDSTNMFASYCWPSLYPTSSQRTDCVTKAWRMILESNKFCVRDDWEVWNCDLIWESTFGDIKIAMKVFHNRQLSVSLDRMIKSSPWYLEEEEDDESDSTNLA